MDGCAEKQLLIHFLDAAEQAAPGAVQEVRTEHDGTFLLGFRAAAPAPPPPERRQEENEPRCVRPSAPAHLEDEDQFIWFTGNDGIKKCFCSSVRICFTHGPV